MATPSLGTKPTPERIFNTLNIFQQTAALKTAIQLDLFTAIGEGAREPNSLAQKLGAAERGVRILCDYLTIIGFLTKEQGNYSLAPDAALFLDRRSPAYLGSIADFLGSESAQQAFAALPQAVRRGGTATQNGDCTKPLDDLWVSFAKNMAPLAVPTAAFLAQLLDVADQRVCKVLDVAAGHGMYGITIAKHNPNAQIVALDWPAVLQVARQNANAHGVSEQFSALPGSAFDTDLGEHYDYVLLTNIFHHFDRPTCETLMRRVYTALKPGGKAATLEFIPDEDRVSPPVAAAFSLIMLAHTDAGEAYTFSEYETMFRNTGFAKTTLHEVPHSMQRILISEKLA